MMGLITSVKERQNGAVLVEFAAVLGLFMLLLWAVLTYGMVFAVNHSLSSAAAESARAAVGAPEGDATTVAADVADDRLSWLGAKASSATVSPSVAPCPDIPGECITVEVSYPYGTDPLVPGLNLLPLPETLSSQATVSLS